MWKTRYHNKYLNFVKRGKSYQTLNVNDDPKFAKSNMALLRGAKMLNQIGGIEFSEYQLDLAKIALPYMVKQFYDDHWDKFKQSIMKMHAIDPKSIEKHQIISETARREGKSTFYRHIVIALALNTPIEHNFPFCIALAAHREDTIIDSMKLIKRDLKAMPEWIAAVERGDIVVLIDSEKCLRFKTRNGLGYVEIQCFAGEDVSLKKGGVFERGVVMAA